MFIPFKFGDTHTDTTPSSASAPNAAAIDPYGYAYAQTTSMNGSNQIIPLQVRAVESSNGMVLLYPVDSQPRAAAPQSSAQMSSFFNAVPYRADVDGTVVQPTTRVMGLENATSISFTAYGARAATEGANSVVYGDVIPGYAGNAVSFPPQQNFMAPHAAPRGEIHAVSLLSPVGGIGGGNQPPSYPARPPLRQNSLTYVLSPDGTQLIPLSQQSGYPEPSRTTASYVLASPSASLQSFDGSHAVGQPGLFTSVNGRVHHTFLAPQSLSQPPDWQRPFQPMPFSPPQSPPRPQPHLLPPPQRPRRQPPPPRRQVEPTSSPSLSAPRHPPPVGRPTLTATAVTPPQTQPPTGRAAAAPLTTPQDGAPQAQAQARAAQQARRVKPRSGARAAASSENGASPQSDAANHNAQPSQVPQRAAPARNNASLPVPLPVPGPPPAPVPLPVPAPIDAEARDAALGFETYSGSTYRNHMIGSLDRVVCFLHSKERSAQNMVVLRRKTTGELVWRCKTTSQCKAKGLCLSPDSGDVECEGEERGGLEERDFSTRAESLSLQSRSLPTDHLVQSSGLVNVLPANSADSVLSSERDEQTTVRLEPGPSAPAQHGLPQPGTWQMQELLGGSSTSNMPFGQLWAGGRFTDDAQLLPPSGAQETARPQSDSTFHFTQRPRTADPALSPGALSQPRESLLAGPQSSSGGSDALAVAHRTSAAHMGMSPASAAGVQRNVTPYSRSSTMSSGHAQ